MYICIEREREKREREREREREKEVTFEKSSVGIVNNVDVLDIENRAILTHCSIYTFVIYIYIDIYIYICLPPISAAPSISTPFLPPSLITLSRSLAAPAAALSSAVGSAFLPLPTKVGGASSVPIHVLRVDPDPTYLHLYIYL